MNGLKSKVDNKQINKFYQSRLCLKRNSVEEKESTLC